MSNASDGLVPTYLSDSTLLVDQAMPLPVLAYFTPVLLMSKYATAAFPVLSTATDGIAPTLPLASTTVGADHSPSMSRVAYISRPPPAASYHAACSTPCASSAVSKFV